MANEFTTVSEIVRALRVRCKLTQAQLSKLAGLSEYHIRNIEKGHAAGRVALQRFLSVAHETECWDLEKALRQIMGLTFADYRSLSLKIFALEHRHEEDQAIMERRLGEIEARIQALSQPAGVTESSSRGGVA